MYDLPIRNGRIVDGTGNPWFRADVGVKDGSIAAIGRIEGKAERLIDAEGLYVAPGFIDVHCHADFTVLDPPNSRDFKLRQGITTECAGQCGDSAAPVNPDTLDLLKAYIAFETPVEGVLSWRWRIFDEYLRELEGFDIPTNFVPMVGHGTVRIDAMRFENRPPTGDELARMKATVGEAMDAGAFGFSVGLAYAPGDYPRNSGAPVLRPPPPHSVSLRVREWPLPGASGSGPSERTGGEFSTGDIMPLCHRVTERNRTVTGAEPNRGDMDTRYYAQTGMNPLSV